MAGTGSGDCLTSLPQRTIAPRARDIMKTADLMTTLEGISDAVVRLDGQGKCMTMNRAAEEIFRRLGRDPAKTIGQSVWDLFPGLKGTVAEQKLRQALDDQRPIQHELYSPSEQRWYESQAFPSSPGVVLIFRDITERMTQHSPETTHTL
jgi:PAS domain S-box-containing protein